MPRRVADAEVPARIALADFRPWRQDRGALPKRPRFVDAQRRRTVEPGSRCWAGAAAEARAAPARPAGLAPISEQTKPSRHLVPDVTRPTYSGVP